MAQTTKNISITVIGGGPGGYAAAFRAADLGMNVTLVDREPNPGGVCLYRGCIPSKALLHVAKVLKESEALSSMGVTFPQPEIDLKRLRNWKEEVVTKLTQGLGQLSKLRKIKYMKGNAIFKDGNTIAIADNRGETTEIRSDYSILATGSIPTSLPGIDYDNSNIMDSTDALALDSIPKSLLVIGGGYIGLELSTVYNALGSDVTVVEMTPNLLPGVDHDLVRVLENRLKTIGIATKLSTKVTDLEQSEHGLNVTFTSDAKSTATESFEKVLVAVGRKPNTSHIGLENTKVTVDNRGFIDVDEQRRTNDPSIFAIGDVSGEPMLAHKATHEGILAADVIGGSRAVFQPRAIPAVVFTHPEIAWCGITEQQAADRNLSVKVTKFPWGASGRATTLGTDQGITKIITDKESERILGVGICGDNAGDLISEGALAIEMAALASDLKLTIHPHPTLSETIMESAELFFGSSTHILRPSRAK